MFGSPTFGDFHIHPANHSPIPRRTLETTKENSKFRVQGFRGVGDLGFRGLRV